MKSSNLNNFSYLYLIIASSIILIIKLFLYSSLLQPSVFGLLSKGLIFSSIMILIGSSGLNVKLQRELPMLLKGTSAARKKSTQLIFFTKSISLLIASILLFAVFLISLFFNIDLSMLLIGIFHGCILNFIYLDLIKLKSNFQFTEYGKLLLIRTVFMTVTGLGSAFYFESANEVLLAEALALLLLQILYERNFISESVNIFTLQKLTFKTIKRLKENYALLTLSLAGVFFINLDKWVAAVFLDNENFGYYSFYWLFVSVGLHLQQALNIKIMPTAALMLHSNKEKCYKYLLRCSLYVAISICLGYFAFSDAIAYFISYLFPEYYSDIHLLPLAILLMVLRGSDYISNFLFLSKNEKYIIHSILFNSLVFIGCLTITKTFFMNVDLKYNLFLIAIIVGIFHYTYLIFKGRLITKKISGQLK